MSTNCRIEAERLRRKYARAFDVPLEEVTYHELPGDEAEVWAPSRPDLPRWSTGNVP